MRVYIRDIGKLRSRHAKQGMFDLDNLLAHDAVSILHHEIIILGDNPCRGILNRQHRIIRVPAGDRLHGVPPGLHMIAVPRILTEILL